METIKKECGLYLLSTDEKVSVGNIFKQTNEVWENDEVGKLYINVNDFITESNENFEAQHLYITSEDEKPDLDKDAVINIDYWRSFSEEKVKSWGYFKKVIASTDPSLNLPFIPKSFVKKYVKKYNKDNEINRVLVDYEENEGISKIKTDNDNYITIHKV